MAGRRTEQVKTGQMNLDNFTGHFGGVGTFVGCLVGAFVGVLEGLKTGKWVLSWALCGRSRGSTRGSRFAFACSVRRPMAQVLSPLLGARPLHKTNEFWAVRRGYPQSAKAHIFNSQC